MFAVMDNDGIISTGFHTESEAVDKRDSLRASDLEINGDLKIIQITGAKK